MKAARSAQMRLTKRAREQMITARLDSAHAWTRILLVREKFPADWYADTEDGRYIRARYAQAAADKQRMESLPDDALLAEIEAWRRRSQWVAGLVAAAGEARKRSVANAAKESAQVRAALRARHDEILRAEVQRMLADSGTMRWPVARIARSIHKRRGQLGIGKLRERTILNKVRRFIAAAPAPQPDERVPTALDRKASKQ